MGAANIWRLAWDMMLASYMYPIAIAVRYELQSVVTYVIDRHYIATLNSSLESYYMCKVICLSALTVVAASELVCSPQLTGVFKGCGVAIFSSVL